MATKIYRVITNGDDLEHSSAYQQFGQWVYIGTHNGGELYEVEVSETQASPFERMCDTDRIVVGYGEKE